MVTRRELVTTGALGMLSGSAARGGEEPASHGTVAQSAEAISAEALRGILRELQAMREALDHALRSNSLTIGALIPIRRAFEQFLRANTKYPDYCEIGPSVFTELYDWHVKQRQPIEVQRVEGRMAIRFMFTWMLLRPEQDLNFVGIPYDRG
jgi:hypothetical protein